MTGGYGYGVCFVTAVAVLLLGEVWRRRRRDALARTRAAIIAYNMAAVFVFLHAPVLYNACTGSYPVSPVNEPEFQPGLCILAATALPQVLLACCLPSLFWRIATPTVIGVFGAATMFPFIGMGTINAIWLFLLQIATGAFLAVAELRWLWMEGIDSSENPRGLIDEVRREFTGFLKMALQAVLALGASIGVSMSILFREGYVAWQNPAYQMNATRLVLGFVLVCAGGLLWLIRPYLDNYVLLRAYARQDAAVTSSPGSSPEVDDDDA